MINLRSIVRGVALAAALALAAIAAADGSVRFAPIDIVVDVGNGRLAAYQIELVVRGDATVVGVEGGAPAAFKAAPYYDPAALAGGRIIVAAFSTADELPSGRIQVATLHMREQGAAPQYEVRVMAAADSDGQPLTIEASAVARPVEK